MKKALIIGISLIIIGAVGFACAMSSCGWDFTALNTTDFDTKIYEPTDVFHSIDVTSADCDVTLRVAEDGVCRVVYDDGKKVLHTVDVKDGVLVVEVDDSRRWYDYISIFSIYTPRIDIYLTRYEYDSIKVKIDTGDVLLPSGFTFGEVTVEGVTGDVECHSDVHGKLLVDISTGDVRIDGITAGEIDVKTTTGDIELADTSCVGSCSLSVSTGDKELSSSFFGALSLKASTGDTELSFVKCDGELVLEVTTGDVRMTDVECVGFSSNGGTGDITLVRTVSAKHLRIKRNSGDVRMDRCDGEALFLETRTGDICGTLLSDKDFDAHSSSGSVRVPRGNGGGLCEITTSTGDITFDVIGG